MAVSAEVTLAQLLPPGLSWTVDPGSVRAQLLAGLGAESDRLQAAAESLLKEADPSQAVELLSAWEQWAGLPDACVPQGQTQTERQQAVVRQLTLVGRQDPAFYVEVAESLDVTARVEEFVPVSCISPCVDPLTQDEPRRAGCTSKCTAALLLNGWRFFWVLRQLAPEIPITYATCLFKCTSPLQKWGNSYLECVVAPMVPAHTSIIHCYGEVN